MLYLEKEKVMKKTLKAKYKSVAIKKIKKSSVIDFNSLILSIPKWSIDHIREVIAFLKLELKLRDEYEKNKNSRLK